MGFLRPAGKGWQSKREPTCSKMPGRRPRKCRCCKELFTPDPRVGVRQKYCSKRECRAASKAARQKRWRQKPNNRDYFSGPVHVERVRRWRKANPGYWKRERRNRPDALQDAVDSQVPDNQKERAKKGPTALQDAVVLQKPVFVGLISSLIDSTLQDDIVGATRRYQQRGLEILGERPGRETANRKVI